MAWKVFPESFMRRIVAAVTWVEQQRRGRGAQPRHQRQILPQLSREFELAEELDPNATAAAYCLTYSGDGDTCTSADFEADTDWTFEVGGGGMNAIRLATFAAGTRGHCRKDPGRTWWTIYQMDCEPQETA